MRYSTVAGVDKPVSRLVLGTMMFAPDRSAHWHELLARYRDSGGNCLDTAAIYGNGDAERVIGEWLTNRDDVVLIGKGACTTDCTPDLITAELRQSLHRLRTDHVDIYLMHRDNPALPVGVFVDRLNEHLRAGEVRAFGGSNWSPERIAEANAYAAERGLVGFAASSPQFSLGRWNGPPWAGCVSAADPPARRWYEESGLALFAWSSQAGGFFTGRYSRADRDTDRSARFWFNDGNFRRLERVRELAARRNVPMAQIALAYVLSQPPHVFALTGALTVEELRDSVAAVDLEVTPAELRHLDLDAG